MNGRTHGKGQPIELNDRKRQGTGAGEVTTRILSPEELDEVLKRLHAPERREWPTSVVAR
ncbi:hypothetical protein CIG75_19130 [Tumebacillus algifaecis]|uniref:Uncharacterized protein n=1 Tax=Tumebacillus algifaecis TaxID=1214604 RepID=A0A223D5T3_9BACL|nr:hypothetical protein [Tumebacillus algifaecis]ASS76847.1 hypothetical protein CIG75_19130 [Tumebacillus algifaecis]